MSLRSSNQQPPDICANAIGSNHQSNRSRIGCNPRTAPLCHVADILVFVVFLRFRKHKIKIYKTTSVNLNCKLLKRKKTQPLGVNLKERSFLNRGKKTVCRSKSLNAHFFQCFFSFFFWQCKKYYVHRKLPNLYETGFTVTITSTKKNRVKLERIY